jgi:hypothetical protein
MYLSWILDLFSLNWDYHHTQWLKFSGWVWWGVGRIWRDGKRERERKNFSSFFHYLGNIMVWTQPTTVKKNNNNLCNSCVILDCLLRIFSFAWYLIEWELSEVSVKHCTKQAITLNPSESSCSMSAMKSFLSLSSGLTLPVGRCVFSEHT